MEKVHTIHSAKFPAITYLKTGSGDAIVLLHGFPESGKLWKEIWNRLSEEHTVIVPDLPGSGGSTWEQENITMEQMAESVKLVMDEEQIDTAVIAGHSMGGYTAMAFADLYPERLAGLSMVHSSAGADTEEKKETRRKSVELIRKGGKEPFVRQMVPALFADEFRTGNPGAVQQQVTSGLEMKPGNMIAFYNAMMNRPDRIAILSKVDFPVQWIIGREDKIASPETVLPQSRLAIVNFVSVYNGCGHMSMLEKPDRLVKDLADFSKYCFGVSR